jgi:hypothetical protein
LLKAGYTFDFVSDRLLKDVTFADGKLHAGGNAYQAIVLPETKYMPLETLEQLIALADQGAKIVVQKSLPADVPGWSDLDGRRNKFHSLLTALEQKKPDHLLIGDDIKALLTDAGVRREKLVESKVQFVRRHDGDRTVYFLANQSSQPIDDNVTLATSGEKFAAILDPMSGRVGKAPVLPATDGGTRVHLQLAPGQACIVETSPTELSGPNWSYYRPHGEAQPLTGTWDVSFVKGGPELPTAKQIEKLSSWTEFGGAAGKAFSGTAKYTLKFAKPQAAGAASRLDLGKVADSARVSLNGEELGVLFTAPFTVDILADKLKDQNTLEISVSNLMANRIADMDKKGVQWKRFYNANVAAHDAANRGANNLFSAAKWEPRPSGLLGPVTLTPLESFDPREKK